MEVKFCDLNPIKVLYASTDCVLGLFIPVLHFVLYIYIFSKKKQTKNLSVNLLYSELLKWQF